MALEFEHTQSRFAIDVPVEDFLLLIKAEGMSGFVETTLGEKLDKIEGVYDVEYNGHFGSFIFLTLEVEHDTEAKRALIVSTIESHLADIKAAARKKRRPPVR